MYISSGTKLEVVKGRHSGLARSVTCSKVERGTSRCNETEACKVEEGVSTRAGSNWGKGQRLVKR